MRLDAATIPPVPLCRKALKGSCPSTPGRSFASSSISERPIRKPESAHFRGRTATSQLWDSRSPVKQNAQATSYRHFPLVPTPPRAASSRMRRHIDTTKRVTHMGESVAPSNDESDNLSNRRYTPSPPQISPRIPLHSKHSTGSQFPPASDTILDRKKLISIRILF